MLQSRINTCFNESLKWDLANGKSEEQRVLFHRGEEQAILETDQSTAQSSGREREMAQLGNGNALPVYF